MLTACFAVAAAQDTSLPRCLLRHRCCSIVLSSVVDVADVVPVTAAADDDDADDDDDMVGGMSTAAANTSTNAISTALATAKKRLELCLKAAVVSVLGLILGVVSARRARMQTEPSSC